MADESLSDTCVPFAVSKVLAITQKRAGELLLAEHKRQSLAASATAADSSW
jgi:hypothetical protein